MLNDHPIYPIDAIRHGFDDRLLALTEFEPGTSVTLETAAERIQAWRAQFEDDLEVVAFVRIGTTPASTSNSANDDPDGSEQQCAAVRALSALKLPVAVAIVQSAESRNDTSQTGADSPGNVEQWTLCENDFRSLLMAIRVPADVLVCKFDRLRAPRTPAMQPFVGLGPSASRAQQLAFVTDFAHGVALRGDAPLGVVLAPFAAWDDSASVNSHRLLGILADAVYRRRIRCAA